MHDISLGRIALMAALLLSCANSRAPADDHPAPWNRAAAERYLDGRANDWFGFAKADRGEGETKTSCVSCHTLAPFAVARPALRKLTSAKQPTDHEQKLLAQVKMRVEHWDELDSSKYGLQYDFDEPKQKQSWGTEAVLNAFVLAFDDRYEGRAVPSDSTRRAFANLWKVQASDGDQSGSWDWLDFKLQPWEASRSRYFGTALAAIALGTAPGYYSPGADADLDTKVQRLIMYLKNRRADQSQFNRVWLLWASKGLDGLLTPDERKSAITELLELQQADGGWRLAMLAGVGARNDGTPQDTTSDGYATGLVLHVLQTVGVPKEEPSIARGLNWLRSNQSPTGEWRTNSINKQRDPTTHVGRFMSDAATAYAILALSH